MTVQSVARVVALLAAAALLLPTPATAVNRTLMLSRDGQNQQRQQPVEQQSPGFPTSDPTTWVTNPLDCDWDVDDETTWFGQGTVEAGTPSVTTTCVVADGADNVSMDSHAVQAHVLSASNNLTVTLTNSQGVSWTAVPTVSKTGAEWKFCVIDPTRAGVYPVIPGSNGGTGIQVFYTLTIAATNRTARSVTAAYQTGGMTPAYNICPPIP
jgi:hypothetical protein